jgi:hypothetical protein
MFGGSFVWLSYYVHGGGGCMALPEHYEDRRRHLDALFRDAQKLCVTTQNRCASSRAALTDIQIRIEITQLLLEQSRQILETQDRIRLTYAHLFM